MTRVEETDAEIEFLRRNLHRPVVVVGMMGVGKTHLGRKLAEKLNLEFKDSDKIVEEKAGSTINEIFAEYGEEKFRQAERNSILEILADGPCILATGGGAVINPETRKAIKSKAVSVWLKVDVKEIVKRLEKAGDRPLLKNGDPEIILTSLIKQREPFYAEADIHIESHENQPEKTLGTLINSLYEHVKSDTV